MTIDYTGKGILVTAAASGIGRAIADTFLACGANVHICDIDATALNAAVMAGGKLRGTIADVGLPQDVDRLFEDARAWLGNIDVLVNNAGIGGPRGPVDELDDAAWDDTIRINLSGAFYCAKRAARSMKEQRSGSILNVSSSSARTGIPNRAPYVASKVGLLGLTHNLARELGPFNVRCNAILPGPIDNARGRALLERRAADEGLSVEETLARRLQFVSMRSLIDPREVGIMATLLASDACRHVTGQMIGVCGNAEWEA